MTADWDAHVIAEVVRPYIIENRITTVRPLCNVSYIQLTLECRS